MLLFLSQAKQINVPIPTEHYRSYRRAPPAPPTAPPTAPLAAPSKLPKPINYIHASNPNLLDFEKSDFVTKPAITVNYSSADESWPISIYGFPKRCAFKCKYRRNAKTGDDSSTILFIFFFFFLLD